MTGDSSSSPPLLICYLPVGDPAASSATVRVYREHGVDIIEAGIPVENPLLDGPEVANSMARAIAAGVTDELVAAEVLGEQLDTAGKPPAVWMSYRADPDATYLNHVASSGAAMVLLPDADPVELVKRADNAGLRAVPFLSHPPQEDQIESAHAASSDYVMVAAAPGVTGERATLGGDNALILKDLRQRGITAPLGLGFGISRPANVRAALEAGADGVIVGSACVRAAREGEQQLSTFLTELREALDEF
jgi:tryptophan synthase alpha chain